MRRGGYVFHLLWGAVLLSFTAGCASKRVNNCIAGALIGAGAGAGIGAVTGGNNNEHSDNAMLGAGIGAVVGGALGCLLTKDEVTAAPPPAPPPPPSEPRVEAPPPPVREIKRFVLRGVNFDYDKANIRSDARAILDEAAQTLKDNPDITVSVEGHTDAIGSDSYNQALSERRAQAAKAYLVSKGIAASRLSTEGRGEQDPIADNMRNGRDNPEGRAMNRRVEMKVR